MSELNYVFSFTFFLSAVTEKEGRSFKLQRENGEVIVTNRKLSVRFCSSVREVRVDQLSNSTFTEVLLYLSPSPSLSISYDACV